MIITAVERTPRRRGLVDVYVDGEQAMQVARKTARAEGLRPGRTIDRSELETIQRAEMRRRALETAVAMLARRPRSERDVRRRLAQRAIPRDVIDETVEKLRSAGFLDDAAYARSFAEMRDRTSPRGRRLIVQELRATGVAPETAQSATSELADEDAAYRLASSRALRLAGLGYETFRNRLAGLLQRRGFGWELVRRTIDRCWRETGGVDDDELELESP